MGSPSYWVLGFNIGFSAAACEKVHASAEPPLFFSGTPSKWFGGMSVVNVLFLKDTPEKGKATCRLCLEVVATPNYGTSGGLAHLEDKHAIKKALFADLASSLVVRGKGTSELSFGALLPVAATPALEESVLQLLVGAGDVR